MQFDNLELLLNLKVGFRDSLINESLMVVDELIHEVLRVGHLSLEQLRSLLLTL